jgi:hypothetical protein
VPEVGYLILVELSTKNVKTMLENHKISPETDSQPNTQPQTPTRDPNTTYLAQEELICEQKISRLTQIGTQAARLTQLGTQPALPKKALMDEYENFKHQQSTAQKKFAEQPQNTNLDNLQPNKEEFIEGVYTEGQLEIILDQLKINKQWNILFERSGNLFFKSENTELLDEKLGDLKKHIIDIQLGIMSNVEEFVNIHNEFLTYADDV